MVISLKKVGIISAAIIFIFVFATMCQEETPEQGEITKENIRQKVTEAYEDVDTYKMDMEMTMDMTMEVEGEKMTMSTNMNMDCVFDEKNMKQMHIFEMVLKIEEINMSYTLKGEMYLTENNHYMKMLGEWYKKELEDVPASAMSQTDAFKNLLNTSEILEMKETTLDGQQVYYLKLEPSLSELVDTYTKTQALYQDLGTMQAEMETEEFEKAIKDFEVYYWISKKDLRIVKTVMEMELDMKDIPEAEGAEAEGRMVTTARFKDYNKSVNIEVPEEAEYAKDWEELSEM